LVDHEVTVELKNDIQIRGTLKSVDQYLNIKLDDIKVVEGLKYPHLVSIGVAERQSWKHSLKRMRGIGADVGLVFGQECFH
jgi:small nuclear ribonucleoprotein (snRNP)-like protein